VSGTRRDPAQEWLSPLRTPGVGLVPQRVEPSWHETAEQIPPDSDDYSDDGWKLPLDDGWSPGPAYIWAPGEEEDWDGQAEGDWDPDGQDWNLSADGTDWAPGELHGPGAFGPGAPGPQQGHQTGPHGYPNGPEPGYLTGPQPLYAAGPEPEPLGGPAPAYLTDTDAGYAAVADAGYLSVGPDAGPARGPGSAYGPETAFREAPAGVPDPGTAQRDDDTSPIPVIRDQGQPAPQPLASEPAPATSFSVWEPAPKPFSVWEPAPKPNLGSGDEGRSDEVYRPSHAEPPSPDTQEKIDQIKDLYLTAEAIGEDALGKHFDELHQRQRSLIREFFEKAGLGPNNTPSMLGDDSAQDGAPLPG
jgi:hypothetical protein